jgi:hypothetical protein
LKTKVSRLLLLQHFDTSTLFAAFERSSGSYEAKYESWSRLCKKTKNCKAELVLQKGTASSSSSSSSAHPFCSTLQKAEKSDSFVHH